MITTIRSRSMGAMGLFLIWATGVANAIDGIVCTGIVSSIGVHSTDRVILKLSGVNPVVQICALTQTIGLTIRSPPISAEQTKALWSLHSFQAFT